MHTLILSYLSLHSFFFKICIDSHFSLHLQLEFQMLNGLALRAITMFWLWTYWDQALKIFSAFVTGSCPSKLF